MRAITATLFLVLLAGAQARHFWQHDEPQKTSMERLQELTQAYVEHLKTGIQSAAAQFDASAVGKQMELNLVSRMDELYAVASSLRENMGPAVEEFVQTVKKEVEDVYKEVDKDMREMRAIIQPPLDRMKEKVHKDLEAARAKLEPIGQELQNLARQNAEVVHQKISPVLEELRDQMRGHVEVMRQELGNQHEKIHEILREKVEHFRAAVVPEMTNYQAKFQEHMGSVRQHIPVIIEKIRTEGAPLLESFKLGFLEVIKELQKEIEQLEQQQQQGA